jgi:hypothetical protein
LVGHFSLHSASERALLRSLEIADFLQSRSRKPVIVRAGTVLMVVAATKVMSDRMPTVRNPDLGL